MKTRTPVTFAVLLLLLSAGCSSWLASAQPNGMTPDRRLELDVNDYTIAVSVLTGLRAAGVVDDDEYAVAAAAKREVRKSLDDRRAAIKAGSLDSPNSDYRTALSAFTAAMYKLREVTADAQKRQPTTRPAAVSPAPAPESEPVPPAPPQ